MSELTELAQQTLAMLDKLRKRCEQILAPDVPASLFEHQ